MFFNDVFDEHISTGLPSEVIFVVEHTVTQILMNCDPDFLRKTLSDKNLPKAIFDELVFYGPVAKPYLFRVESYLQKQENALSQVAEMLLKEPDNRILRERLASPSRFPEASFSK
jgi:hypothetical protein